MEKPPNPVYFFIKFPADLQEGNIETSFEKDHTFLPPIKYMAFQDSWTLKRGLFCIFNFLTNPLW